MRATAKPAVSLAVRVDIETDERRRRLQQQTGLSAARLVAVALRTLEARLDAEITGAPVL